MRLSFDSDKIVAIRRLPLRLILFGGAGLASFGFGFLAHSPAEAGRLIQHFGYFAMAGTFVWWLFSLHPVIKPAHWRDMLRPLSRHRSAIWLILGLTLVAILTLPYTYKILYDELVLQATAWNIHFFREFGTIVRGYNVDGVFHSIDVYLDKRPFFYPFIVSLAHDLTGYREINAYLINTLLLPVCLGLGYIVFQRLGGFFSGLAGMVCFGASSLLAQNANGTGMEMLNLAMLLLVLWLAIRYLSEPGDATLSALILSCVLLAQTRYESALYVAPTAFVILEGWRRSGKIILPAAALLAPILLIPSALHNTYLSGTPSLWELREDAVSRFALKYLPENLQHACLYLFDFSGQQLNSWWLSIIGISATTAATYLVLKRWRAWKDASPAVVSSVLYGSAILGNLGLLMFYYWGHLDDPIVSRLILPANIVFAISITWLFSKAGIRWHRRACNYLIAGALITYVGFGLRATAFNMKRNELATEMAWEERLIAARASVPRLVISNKSLLNWMIQSTPAISITHARVRAEQVRFHLNAGTFSEVLVTQYYRPVTEDGDFQLDPRDELPSAYVLEPIVEHRFGARLLRISRVVDIKLPPKEGPERHEGNASPASGTRSASVLPPPASIHSVSATVL